MKKIFTENKFALVLMALLLVNSALLIMHISITTYNVFNIAEGAPLPFKSNTEESLDMMDELFSEEHERAETVLESYSTLSPAFNSKMVLKKIRYDGYYFELIEYPEHPEDFGNMVYVDNKTIIENKMQGLKVGSIVTGVFSDMTLQELISIQPELPSAQTIHHQ